MAEYWQNVQERAQATIAVWQAHIPGLVLGETSLAGFITLTAALPGLAQTRDNARQALDEARQSRDFASERLRDVGLRVPKNIEGRVEPESGVIDDLDKVYAIRPTSYGKTVARGRRLVPVWVAADAWLAAQNPPQPPIECAGCDAQGFRAKLDAFGPFLQEVANAGKDHDAARDELQRAARHVENLCIRFLKAAKSLAAPGSPAEAALDTIPTKKKKKKLPGAPHIRSVCGPVPRTDLKNLPSL